MKETPMRRVTNTSSLNEIPADQLGKYRGGGGGGGGQSYSPPRPLLQMRYDMNEWKISNAGR
jgi:hypothetical protein